MDVNFTTVGLVKCITWILFQFLQDTVAYVAEMQIKTGENISLFDLENLKGYKCGSTGTFRNGDIDTERKANCPKEVWICFDACGVGMYGKLKTTNPSGNLVTWMADPPQWPTGIFSVKEYGFDFMFNESSTLTRSAVYNPGPPEVHPKFFYISSLNPAEPVNNLPIFNPSGSTNFVEATKLLVRYVFDDSCTKPTLVKETTTCEEALADARPMTTTKATTTGDSTTTTNRAPTTTTTISTETSTTADTTTTTEPSTTEQPTTTESATEKMTSKTTSFPENTTPETTPDTTAVQTVTRFIDTTNLHDTTAMAYVTSTTTYINTTRKLYMCPCDCDYYAKVKYWENVTAQNLTLEQQLQRLQPEIEATKKELTVNKSDLSSFRNKKISASDDRTSSKSIGLISTVFMCLVIGSLIVCDLMSLKKHVRHVRKNCCSKSYNA